MSRKLSPDEIASLGLDSGGDAPAEAPAGSRRLSGAEVAQLGLEAPHVGPYRTNPTFATAPAPAGVPNLPPREAVPPMRPQHAQSEAALEGVLGGASLGFNDEAGAALEALGHRLPMSDNPEFGGIPGSLPEAAKERAAQPQKPFAQDYRDERDAARANTAEVRKDWPKTVLAGEVAGSMATGGAGAGRGALANIGRAAATGAAAGLGNSEADVTRGDVGGALKDAATGAAVGGAIGAAGEGAKAAVKGVAKLVTGDLKRRILNEVAEGTSNVSQTERKRLNQAGDSIVREITTGPDGQAVRAAYSGGSATEGLRRLAPIVDKIGAKTDRQYKAFEAAGRGAVDVPAYLAKLDAARKAALKAGDARLADGIEPVRDKIQAVADELGGLSLVQLRKLTTQAQSTAANKLGSLLERENAKDARRVMGVVTEAMDDTVTDHAAGDPALIAAAKKIRRNNDRMHALLTVTDALEVRARKESSAPGLLVRGAKTLTTPAAGATLGAVTASNDEDRTMRALGGAAAGALAVPAARALERQYTSAAINAVRPGASIIPGATRAAGLLGRIGGGMIVGKKQDDDEETK